LEEMHDHDDAVSAGWVRGPGDLVEGEAVHGSKEIHTMDPIPFKDSLVERACDMPRTVDQREGVRDRVDN
jgi:hypothetical protein